MDTGILGNLGKLSFQETLANKAASLGRNAGTADAGERQRVAREFASFLFLEVLKALRAAIPQEGLLESESLSRDIYTSMMDTEIARLMAQRDTSGFTKTVEQSLEKVAVKAVNYGEVRQQPVHGIVSSGFGPRNDPFSGERSFHNGIDIAAPAGSPVKAATAGKVIFSGWAAGYGNLVELDHGAGVVTRYAHNQTNLVTVGEEISPGQLIALVGNTGRATEAHLHFEVRRYGKPIDPKALLGAVSKGTRLSSVV
jgi:murein DD-endopeptidase MepM/ murein hydrolase activator NlpD